MPFATVIILFLQQIDSVMNRFSPATISCLGSARLGAIFLCISSYAAYGQLAESNRLLPAWRQELEEAWSKRTSSLKSLALQLEIDRIIMGSAQSDAGIGIAPNDPKPDLHAKVSASYHCEQGKISLRRKSDAVILPSDPENPVSQDLQLAFDGAQTRQLIQQSKPTLPLGAIEIGPTPSVKLIANVDLIAIGLWRDPRRVLDKVGWSSDEMTILEDKVDIDETNCSRVTIPRRGPRNETSTLDVMADGSFLPVQWQVWHGKHLAWQLTMKYSQDEVLTSRKQISEWNYIEFDLRGNPEEIRRGKVISCSVDEDIFDSTFEIQFPVGTHVIKMQGGAKTFSIQREAGLVPITNEEYGRVPPSS